MCGIAGVIYADPRRSVSPNVLEAMSTAIAHRGPDGEGHFSECGVALVHRRLSILDLESGSQPLFNEDATVAVVFNGEIYNFQELRAELMADGHVFRSRSDTEVLVHLYEKQGPALVNRLRGMFAFAIWDRRRRALLLARDRVGLKPLYVYRDREKLIFGSELKAILAHPDVDRTIDLFALEEFLAYGMVVAPRTIFARASKLPAAHTVSITANRLDADPVRYWELRFEPDNARSLDDWKDALDAKVAESVKMHLLSDVPVGAFLSGGLDSSVVVASASSFISEPLRTFCIGFNESDYSELPFANEVAEAFGTRHQTRIATPSGIELLERLTYHFDEPFADSSALPTFLVSKLASESVKVVLSGDGGDEAFGGYERYAHDLVEAQLRSQLPDWVKRKVIAPAAGIWPKADWLPRPLRAKTRLTNLSMGASDAYANSSQFCRMPLRRTLIAPDIRQQLNGYDANVVIRDAYDAGSKKDPLARMLSADVSVRLPDDYLAKVDRASMAFGLEVRPPLLDHELLELAATVPSNLKVHNGTTKWLFKETFRDRLPAQVTRRHKRGFAIPLDSWMRAPLRDIFEDMVLSRSSPVRGLIQQPAVKRIHSSHVRGTARHGTILWSLLVLAYWCKRYRPAL